MPSNRGKLARFGQDYPPSFPAAVIGAIHRGKMSHDTDSRKGGKPRFAAVSPGRRKNMQANRAKDTGPEMLVRRLLHACGYRYRLHVRFLPGKPDLVFAARRKVVEIRGCYWHGHGCPKLGQLPKTRTEYWLPKIAGNQARDARNVAALRASGWDVLELWECVIRRGGAELEGSLIRFLGPPRLSAARRLRIPGH